LTDQANSLPFVLVFKILKSVINKVRIKKKLEYEY
jgi:hypothetical protein